MSRHQRPPHRRLAALLLAAAVAGGIGYLLADREDLRAPLSSPVVPAPATGLIPARPLPSSLSASIAPPASAIAHAPPAEFEREVRTARPDQPAEAAAFRYLQLQDETGNVPADGLIRAREHIDAMRENNSSAGAGVTATNWTWLGPGNIGGRVRSLVVHPTTTSTWFTGSVSGGIWRTTDSGASWAPVDDFMANLGVSSMVMQPGSPSTMYAGTGEGYNNSDQVRGAGIFKSTDGGSTWAQLSATANSNFYQVTRLAMSPAGTTLLAATRSGLFRSTDGGATFTNVNGAATSDVNFNPSDSTRAVVSGFNGNAWHSTDSGVTWTAAQGLPGQGRVEIAYAPNTPSIVYASVDVGSGAIYKSTDGGATFSLVFNGTPDYLGSQGWYDNALWVDPTNPNFLIVGGIDLWKSTNGGVSWTKISAWASAPSSAHADHHVIVEMPGFNGSTNTTVLFGNDGGVYSAASVYTVGSSASGYTSGWVEKNNNLGITQYYGAAGNASTGTIVGGTQDNGTLRYTTAGGAQDHTATFGGDGGFCAADPTNSSYFYGEYVRLQIFRSTNGGQSASYIYNGIGDAGSSANFIAPFILDPNEANRMLAGGNQLWRSNNVKATTPSWTSIKPAGGAYISAIAVAPGNSDVCWVGHNNGEVYRSANCTAVTPAWTRVDQTSPALPNRFVQRLTAESATRVYAAFGGFSSTNLWRTTDSGATWTDVSGSGVTGLPDVPVRDLDVHPTNANWLYAATESGIFTSEDSGATWQLPQSGPANVSVDEMFWMGSSLVAATHGRGLYQATPGGGTACGNIVVAQVPPGVTAAAGGGSSALPSGAGLQPPSSEGLPPGGVWTRRPRPGGETWEYTFTVPPADASGSADVAPASQLIAGSSGSTSIEREEPATPGSAAEEGSSSARPADDPATSAFSTGTLIQPRFVVDTDPTQPLSGTGDPGVYEAFFSDSDFPLPPEVAAVNPSHSSGWLPIGDDVDLVRNAGIRYRRVKADALPGVLPDGTASATPRGSMAARLTTAVSLPAGRNGTPGLAAFDIGFDESIDPLDTGSARLLLKLSHPSLDQLTVWLAAGDREIVLWDGRGGSDDGDLDDDPLWDSTVLLDRILPNELSGLPLDERWTLYVSNADQNADGSLDDLGVIVHATSPAETGLGEPGAIDLVAGRSYLRTAVNSGSEVGTPAVGQIVFFHSDWSVPGTGSVNVAVRAVLDNSTYCSGVFAVTGNTTWVTWCNSGWTATAGSHTLRWDLDYSNTISETDESNNSSSKSWTTSGGSLDLAADRAYLRTASNGGGSEVTTPAVGQAVYFHVDWRVTGSGSAVSVAQRAVMDGSTFCSFSSSASPGNSYWSWCNSAWTATAGSHTLQWELDYTGTIAESSESNNSSSKSWTTTGTSLDLEAQRAYLRTAANGGTEVATPTVGQAVYFHLDWRTTGSGSAVSVPLRAVLDGSTFCSASAQSAIGVSYITWCTNAWTATAGSHTLQWDLDYTGTISESSESNNSTSRSWTTSGTSLDVEAQRAYLRTAANGGTEVATPTVGQAVNFHLDWRVTGTGSAVTVVQRALLDSVLYCSFNSTASPGTGYLSWCNAAWAATAGGHTLQWDLDYTGTIAESSESNNSANMAWSTTGAPLDLQAQRAYLRTAAGNGGAEVGTPSVGQTVYFYLDWRTTGSGAGATVTQRLLLDGTVICTCSSAATPGATYVSWCAQPWTVTAGAHTIRWELDYTNALVEPNEGNNAATASFGSVVPPAIVVTPDGSQPLAAGSLLTVTLSNGPGNVNDYAALMCPATQPDGAYFDYKYLSNTRTPPSSGLANATLTFNLPSQPTTCQVRWYSNHTYTRLATSQTVTIQPGVSINDVAIFEGNSGTTNAIFTVSLSGPGSQAVTLNYATTDQLAPDPPWESATPGSDYTATSGTLTIPAGALSATIAVPIVGDGVFEPSERFAMVLTNVTGAVLTDGVGWITIRNDDSGPRLTINDVSVIEGQSGTTPATFTVSLAQGPGGAVTVQYATSPQSATAGSDYTTTTGTLTFAPGVTTQTITVPVVGDTVREASETWLVTLSGVSANAEISDAVGVGTILDDDGPLITLGATSMAAGGLLTATLTNGPGNIFDYVTLMCPATLPDGAYTAFKYLSNTQVPPVSGLTAATVTFLLPPQASSCQVRWYSNHTYTRLATSQTVTVQPGLAINDVSVNEGNGGTANATFTVGLSGPSSQPVTMTYATADQTATAGSDYTATSGNLTIPVGTLFATIAVPITGDGTFEPGETFTVALSNVAGALLTDGTGVGTIRNDDAGPRLTIDDVSVIEGQSGTTPAVFTVSLAQGPGASVTVQYATTPQTATAGSDYTTTTGTLTFAPGVTTQTITVPVVGDTTRESPETWLVTLSNASANAEIGDAVGLGTILDDDGPLITLGATSMAAGGLLTATLTNGPGNIFDYVTLMCPATQPDGAYTAFKYLSNTQLPPVSGLTAATVTFLLPPQAVSCQVRWYSNHSYVRLATSQTVTVQSGLSINDVSVNEGNAGNTNATFIVSLSGPSAVPVSVNYTTADQTATAGSDYTAVSGTLTIPPGALGATIAVTVSGDATFEPGETFTVQLSNVSGALLTDGLGIGTIRNDDSGPRLTIDDVSVIEGQSGTTPAVFTVSLAQGPGASVTVQYATTPQSATAGSDYTTTTGTLTFSPGVTTQTITVPVVGDTARENAETWIVTLSNASANAEIGDPEGVGTILDDDGPLLTLGATTMAAGGLLTASLTNGPGNIFDYVTLMCPATRPDGAYTAFKYLSNTQVPPVSGLTAATVTFLLPPQASSCQVRWYSNHTYTRLATSQTITVLPGLSINDVSVNEGNAGSSNATFTVALSGPSSQPVTMTYATADQTATAGSDYTAANGNLTIPTGALSATIAVPISGDGTFEPGETFTVQLTNVTGALLTDGVGVGTIRNDDFGPRLTIDDVSVIEGQSGTTPAVFTVSLAQGPGASVTVQYATTPQTATAGSDYTTTTGTLTFAPGVTTQTITVPVVGDTTRESAETWLVTLSNASANAEIGDAQGIGTILDDDGPLLTLGATSMAAGGLLTATLTNGPGNVFDYVTLMCPATQPDGAYTAFKYLSNTQVPPVTGLTAATVTFLLPPQAVSCQVRWYSNHSYVRLATSQTVTVQPGLSINDVSVNEGNAGSTNATFIVSLSGPSALPVSMNYTTADQTATAGSDYTTTSGTLTIPAGTLFATIAVPISGDGTFEPGETFTVQLSNVTGALLTDGVGAGTIRNDDAGPRLTINDVSVIEGQSGTTPAVFTVTLAQGPGASVTVQYATTPQTATAGTDYTPTTGTLTFAPGVTTQTITVPVVGDTARETTETWLVTLSNASANAEIGDAVGVGTILDDDGPLITLGATTMAAGGLLTATLTNGPGNIFDYVTLMCPATQPDGAYAAFKYLTNTQVPPVAGMTTATVTFLVPPQAATCQVRWYSNHTYTRLATSQTVTVQPGLSINDVSVNEGNAGSSNATFTVALSGPSSQPVTMAYATADQTATAGSDYTATSGNVTIPAGALSATIAVPVTGDGVFEPGETFAMQLSSVTGALLTDGVGVGTIQNDDAGPRLSINDVSVVEGQSGTTPAVFTVTLTQGPAASVTVQYATTTQTAVAGSDYTTTTGTVTFAPGVTAQTITVPVVGDTARENTETFLVTLSNATTNAEIGDGVGIGTIVDDDGPLVTLGATSLAAGSVLTATLQNGPANPFDYAALMCPSTQPDGSYTDYKYLTNTKTPPPTGLAGATITFVVPNQPSCEVRWYSNHTYTRLATSQVVTVTQPPPACTDSDGDRLCNAVETNTGVFLGVNNTGTNPNIADTDGDGVKDGDEVLGTLGGLNLPAMGASPLKKNILLEYDWFDDNSEPGTCTAHSHRPTQAMIDRVTASFAASPVTNPDGTTGIAVIQDYGQGGAFTNGALVSHAANITGGVNGADYNSVKTANFASNRAAYFHYVVMGHWHTDSLGSSGQAELPGNDLIVTLGCFATTNNVANTIMHELGHNLGLRHGGNENCNWKPNYNSVMNYRFQFPGVDTSCNAVGSSGEANLLDYSRGTRIALNESSLNENAGVCGSTAVDWNFSGTFTSGLTYDLNRTSSTPNSSTGVDNSSCSATLQTLNDVNDWANLSFNGLGDSDGQTLFGMFLKLIQEESDCDNPNLPEVVPVAVRPQ